MLSAKSCLKRRPLIREHKAFAAYIETGDRHGLSTIEDSRLP